LTRAKHKHESLHKAFWKGELFERWKVAAVAVTAAIGLPFEGLRQLGVERVGHLPAARTIRRNLGLEGRPTESPHYYAHSVLCLELDAYLDRLDLTRFDKVAGEIKAIRGLAEMVRERSELLEGQAPSLPSPTASRIPDFTVSPARLRKILRSLPRRSPRPDPKSPIFPVNSPRFPATPHDLLQEEPYTLIIKDESYNPTGTHKDRWALEKLFKYREYLEGEERRVRSGRTPVILQPMSMISSGSAAYALQSLLRLYGLPPLRVVMDRSRSGRFASKLRGIGARVSLVNLDSGFLGSDEVKALTHNPDGFEITTRDVGTPGREFFYDWLACEILQLEPTHIFVPFGTGDLFTGLLEMIHQANLKSDMDPRLEGLSEENFPGIHAMGAVPKGAKTVMDKLYAYIRPTEDDVRKRMQELIDCGHLGRRTDIIPVEENFASEALKEAHKRDLNAEHSGIAGLALLRKLEREKKITLSEEHTVVVVNTGWLRIRPE
jgi:hypothetical protein